jgi:hypothetical protein
MEPRQCLFFHESSNCSDVVENEHIIQKGLGGTLSSPDIICANCNNFFSQELDPHLINFYEPIIKILSPLLFGNLKRKRMKTKLISGKEQIDIEYRGGVVNLPEISYRYNSNGQLEEITAPSSIPIEKLKEIAKHKGAKHISFETRFITERYPDGIEKSCFDVNPALMRAILRDILELAHYGYTIKKFPNIAMHRCLNKLRFWIRTGRSTNQFPPRDICFSFAPISDLLDVLFEPSTFSHRLVVSYDYKSKAFILVAQFVNTMPWVFIFENVAAHSHSVSILYKKALLDGKDQLWSPNYAVLDIHNIKWRRFSIATRYAIEFAQKKFEQGFLTQRARAHYESDLRSDDYISQKFTYYINDFSSKTDTPEIDAIVKRIQEQYQESQYLKDILEITRKEALEIWTNTRFDNGQRDQKVLFVYRECLKNIKNTFGYPAICVDLDSHVC